MKKQNVKSDCCNSCGGKGADLLFKNYDHSKKNNQTFNIIKCRRCGLVRISPRPTKSKDCYPDDYEPYSLKNRDFYYSLTRTLMLSYYKKIKTPATIFKALVCKILYAPPELIKNGKVLDIGCGNGGYLSILKDCGWKVYGLDFSEKAVRCAREKRGLKNVKKTKAENLPYPERFFDLITMNHVIEHLTDPRKTLKEAKRVLVKYV